MLVFYSSLALVFVIAAYIESVLVLSPIRTAIKENINNSYTRYPKCVLASIFIVFVISFPLVCYAYLTKEGRASFRNSFTKLILKPD